MRRRTVLRTAAVGAAAALAGCGDVLRREEPATPSPTPRPPPAPEETPSYDQYETVVDLVEEGADPTGSESILPLLDRYAGDDTLLHLGEGRFLVDETWSLDGISNLAIVGDGATVLPEPGTTDVLFSIEATRALHIEGLQFDLTDANTGGRMLNLRVGDELYIGNVDINGTLDSGPSPVRLDVRDEGGSGLIERLRLPDGATAESMITGVFVGDGNRGDVEFRDCHIEGFPDNGLYADPPGGRISVIGGYYANCGISNVRVKGGSIVRGVHVRCDDAPSGFVNMRGIRVTDFEPRPESEPTVVADCIVELLDVTHSDGAIELSSQLAQMEIRNTRIRIDVDGVNAVRAKSPSQVVRNGSTPPRVYGENLQITGHASGNSAIRIDDRNGCVLERVFVHQTGSERHGIEFRRSANNRVTNSILNVTGDEIVLTNSTVDVENAENAVVPRPFRT